MKSIAGNLPVKKSKPSRWSCRNNVGPDGRPMVTKPNIDARTTKPFKTNNGGPEPTPKPVIENTEDWISKPEVIVRSTQKVENEQPGIRRS